MILLKIIIETTIITIKTIYKTITKNKIKNETFKQN